MVKAKKKARLKAFKPVMIILLCTFVVGMFALGGVVLAIIKTAPPLDVNQMLTLNEPSALYNDQDKFMDVVVTNEQRKVLQFNDIPQNLKNAFVSIEDERFYKHKGIDLRRIGSVIYTDIVSKIKKQSKIQGASTITQQLIKTTILTPQVTFTRKIQEMYLAVKLEKVLSKDQILEAYMNTIFLGGRAYGVESAAEQYFNKNAKDLNLIESAYIAGVPQSPSVYYAFSTSSKKDPSIYLNRTKMVLKKMYDNKYITKAQYDSAINDLNNKKLVFQSQSASSISKLNYEYFTLPAIQQVKEDLIQQYHYTDDEVDKLLMCGGLKIYTTMNQQLQDQTQKILDQDPSLNSISGTKKGSIEPQASAVVMDYHTGEVKTIVGGRGNHPALSYNRAASDKFLRPTGSSIKPLTVYSAAIDSKQATAATVIEDSPLPADIGMKYGSASNPYNPKNDDFSYSGYVNLRTAITHSINIVAVKLEDKIGLSTGISYGEKYNLDFDNHDKTSIAAIALGQLHKGTNPLHMAAAYGTFGNQGVYTYAKLYRKVVDRTGKVILESKTKTNQIISPQSAYIMYDLLKGPVSSEGTGPSANFGNVDVRGKTGTSGDKRDLWFCGLTPYYSAAVWIGNDDNSVVNGLISNNAAELWGKIMYNFHKNLQNKQINMPSGIVNATVCRDSGKLPIDACSKDPRGSRLYNEMFIEGTLPTDNCDIHVEVKINKITGKIASDFTPSFLTETKVYIKRDYKPTVPLADQQYVIPSAIDNYLPNAQTETNIPTNGDQNNSTNDGTSNDNLDGSNSNTNSNNNSSSNHKKK